MDYEKKYKAALGWMRGMYDGFHGKTKKEAEKYFPELAESEDEKIRKEIISHLQHEYVVKRYVSDVEYDRWIAWLEKQGEQKPADKVEPKFHEGEWIVDSQGFTHQIERVVENVTTHTFGYDIVGGGYFNEDNKNIHLWTIQDAKDGDVLASGHLVFIFKVIHGVWLNCHCSAHNDGSFIADSYDLMTNKYFSEVHPATKEQRDLLFAKMKEAGYEWDAEKKELKMLEKQGKPKWTDEDEERLQSCIIELQGKGLMGGVDTIDTKWLKSLKQRINDNFEKTCKDDILLDLLQKMPPFITVDGVDYYFVIKNLLLHSLL